MQNDVAVVILAAGKGTRMKSDRAKVLHEVQGRPMIHYVVDAARSISTEGIVVVVGHQAERVRASVSAVADTAFALQEEQLGTGHAVQCALPECGKKRDVVILCGDVPLIKPESISRLVSCHREDGCAVTVMGVKLDDPTGYGRMKLSEGGGVTCIVEEADASPDEKKIDVVNAGIYCVEREFLAGALGRLDKGNAQGELYLTDIVGTAHRQGRRIGMVLVADPTEVIGVNSREDLAEVDGIMASVL